MSGFSIGYFKAESGRVRRAAYAACKTDWQKARGRFPRSRQCGDDLLVELFNATNRFFKSADGREAFRGGWTAEELFGITLEEPRRLGAISAAVYANLHIIRFDGPWIWTAAPPIDGGE